MISVWKRKNDQFLLRPDGAEIRWKKRSDGFPLLLVPGLGGDRDCWGAQFPRKLTELGIAPVIYDPRGFGESSSGTSVPSMELYADDAAAIIKAAGTPCAVFGWSMGASVALELALAHPNLADRLILCCGSGDHRELVRSRPEIFEPILDGEIPLNILAARLAEILAPAEWKENFAALESFRSATESSFLKSAKGIRSQQYALKTCPPALDRLERIRISVMVIEGAEDMLIPPEEGEKLLRALPDGRREILHGGHGLIYERPEDVANLTAAFLTEKADG